MPFRLPRSCRACSSSSSHSTTGAGRRASTAIGSMAIGRARYSCWPPARSAGSCGNSGTCGRTRSGCTSFRRARARSFLRCRWSGFSVSYPSPSNTSSCSTSSLRRSRATTHSISERYSIGPGRWEALHHLALFAYQQRVEDEHPEAIAHRHRRAMRLETTRANGVENRGHRRPGIHERVMAAEHPEIVRVGVRNDRLVVFFGDADRLLVEPIEPREMNLRVLDRVEQIDIRLETVPKAVSDRVKRMRGNHEQIPAAFAFAGAKSVKGDQL